VLNGVIGSADAAATSVPTDSAASAAAAALAPLTTPRLL
jgi:hypothetical protein